MIHDVRCGISNLVTWFKIIWHDRWWDHHYLYEILRFKLQLMEQKFRKDGNYIGSHKDANKMKRCIFVLNRIIDDNYSENAYKRHDKKWGDLKMRSAPTDNKHLRELLFSRPKAITEKEQEHERKETLSCIEHEYYLKQQDLKLLFKLLEKNVEKWWD